MMEDVLVLGCFREKTTFYACLFISEINSKSLFSSLAEMLVSFTTEKRDVSSAKSLAVEVILSDKSLIYTKKNRGPKMEPFGTPASTSHYFW